MAKKPCALGGIEFSKKADAKAYVRSILHANAQVGIVTDATHAAVLRDLLRRHYRHSWYDAIGVIGFETWVDPYRSIGFRVRLADGTSDSFSYVTAFDGLNPWDRVVHAHRESVKHQIYAAKEAMRSAAPGGVVRCAVSGVVLEGRDFHADHVVPFSEILRAFRTKDALLNVPIIDAPDGAGTVLNDATYEAEWRAYHAQHARFQPLCAKENMARYAREKASA